MDMSIFKSIERMIKFVCQSIELEYAGDMESFSQRRSKQQDYHDRYEKRSQRSMPKTVGLALNLNEKA